MLKTLLGIILLIVPFLLLYRFKDKKLGFAYILSFLIAFHLAIAIITQAFGVFRYSLIIGINLILDIIILVRINYKEFFNSIKKINSKKIDWILVFVIVIIFIELFSVHYNYTGKVTTAAENYKEVKNMKYAYPYFSDEWSAVVFVKYSIESGKLPLANILWYNSEFSNFEFSFHSFISEIILLLNLNPLVHYTLLTIFSGLIICLLVYFILLLNKVGKLAASIACLFVPYIANGANLPGLWTLIPLIMGLISLLLGLLFLSADRKNMSLFLAFLTLVFYPPLFVFYTISLIFYFIFSAAPKKEKIKLISLYFAICFIAALFMIARIFLTNNYSYDNTVAQVKSRVYYPTLTSGAIPEFLIYKIIPFPILLFSIFGVFKAFKKKLWLIIPAFIGLAYWWFYSFMLLRFIIEYERVIVSTAILITILAGFGLNYFTELLEKIKFIEKYKILKIIQIGILILFFVFAFFYTQRDNWQDLKLHSVYDDSVYNPASPTNRYLQEDDLRLFANITGKKFLSLPWKGLVIGVATNNYPLETKDSTITNRMVRYSYFLSVDCDNKTSIAKDKQIDYVYSREFNCTGFKEIGKSEENLVLYEVE